MSREIAFGVDMRRLLQTRGPDAMLARAAEAQHGVVARRQLLEWGMGPSAIDRRLRLGRLHRLRLGVYSVGHGCVSQQGRWLAAVLTSGSGAALSHRSAAALWRIRPLGSHPIEVTGRPRSRSGDGVHRHSAALPADERTTESGIAVTTVPRTLFDLATVCSLDLVESALRESEFLRLHDRLSLPDLLERYPRRRGAAKLKACLARRAELPVGRTRSRLEERFLPLLDRHRLPRPQLNAWVAAGGRSFQVDCLWPRASIVVELDGFEAHGIRPAFESDRARDRALQVAGHRVLRLTWRQLEDEPEAVAADLRAILSPTV